MEVYTKCGTAVLIDSDYVSTFNLHSWRLDRYGYARRTTTRTVNGRRTPGITILLHKQIIGDVPPGLEIDHINRNKRDNRRCNLRVVDHSTNVRNSDRFGPAVTGVTGIVTPAGLSVVRRIKRYKLKYYASLVVDGKQKYVGNFTNRDVAVSACADARIRLIEGMKAR